MSNSVGDTKQPMGPVMGAAAVVPGQGVLVVVQEDFDLATVYRVRSAVLPDDLLCGLLNKYTGVPLADVLRLEEEGFDPSPRETWYAEEE
ncbi:MAG: hypothetical protein ABIH46_07835 [Chloroflexota bacterium]